MSSRPSFARSNTDISLTHLDNKNGEQSSSNIYQAGDRKHSIGKEEHGKTAEVNGTDDLPAYDVDEDYGHGHMRRVSDAKDIVTSVLHVEDDPSINPWTFRMFFLGG